MKMTVRNISHTLLFIVLALLAPLSACRKPAGSAKNFDKEIYSPRYASGFRILGAEGRESVIIESMEPWQGADSVVTRLFISRGGEPEPEGFEGRVLVDSAMRIVTMSSTHIAMLDAIGCVDRVVGVSGMDYISNPKIRAAASRIADVGYEGNVNYEALVALDPDIVLLYGTNGASPMESKLDELGIPYVYIGDYLEEDPVGKAEWLVAIAEIVGRRDAGLNAFNPIPERYEALRRKVADAGLPAPKVMLNSPYGDTWFMASTGSYVSRLIRDAGGEYIYKVNSANASLPVDMEQAYMLASSSDKWINIGKFFSLDEVRKALPRFTDTAPVRNGEVYADNARVNASGGNDYWESGVVHPDLVLRDFVKMFHPKLVEDDFVYYRKLQ